MDIINEGLDGLGSRTMFLHYSDRYVVSVRLLFPMHALIGSPHNHLEHPIDNTHPNFLIFLVDFYNILLIPPLHTVNICLAIHAACDFYSLPRCPVRVFLTLLAF